MEVRVTKNGDGVIDYKELIDSSYGALAELKKQYENMGFRAWINPWSLSKWVLTIYPYNNGN